MKTFKQWLKSRHLNESSHSSKNGRELIQLLKKIDWIDNNGKIGEYVGWEASTKENKVYIRHADLGIISIPFSRASKIPAKQIMKSVLSDYKRKVEEIQRIKIAV